MPRVTLLCSSCGLRKMQELSEDEAEALRREEPVSRVCENCQETTEWFLAEPPETG